MRPIEQERPTVKVFLAPNHGREETLRQLLYGIEEEGIPYDVAEGKGGDAVALAWDASRQSRLEVGLGLSSEKLVLHFGKLEANQPLFVISARSPVNEVRAMGANAARLVKKLPFKPLKEEPKEVKQ